MSKSKKERQQEKKELRQAQEKAQPKQPQAEKKPEPKPVEAKNAQPETAADVKMNFYSGMSMIMTIMAAASAVVAMIVAARGFYYILQTLYDETQTDIVLLSDNLSIDPHLSVCDGTADGGTSGVISGRYGNSNQSKEETTLPNLRCDDDTGGSNTGALFDWTFEDRRYRQYVLQSGDA